MKTAKEFWRRVTSPACLLSLVRDAYFHLWDTCSPGAFAQLYRLVHPYTLCGNARLRGLYRAVRDVVAHGIPGDIVECGTARGGSAALLGLTLKQFGVSRPLWVFDTFKGIPAPTSANPDWDTAHLYTGAFRGELEEVSALFERVGILADCRLIKGLFQETLPSCSVGSIAVLHLDGDWYESVKVCLDTLYDRVSSGGVIQIDDYGHWEGAKKAVDEFLRARAIAVRLRWLDYTGRQFVKP